MRTLAFEFLIELTSAGHTKGAYELLEVDCTVLVLVEYIEDKIGKLSRIAKGKELLVDPAEFRSVELTRGTVLQEALVPAKFVSRSEFCGDDNDNGRRQTIAGAPSCRLGNS